MADVHGVDVRRSALEQAVGEAAGRGSRIEGAPVGDGDRKPVQCGLQLEAATADEGRGRPEQDDGLVRGDQARRLPGGCTGDEDAAGGDGRLGLLPGVDEAASHELGVEPAAGPAGQLAAFLVAELSASEPFLFLAVGLLGLRLRRARRRLDAREAGRSHLGGGIAGPRGRLAGRAADAPGRLARLCGHALGRLPGLRGHVLGGLAGLRGHVLGGVAAGLGRLLHDLGHLLGQGLQGLRVDALELAGHLVAHQFEDLLAGLAAPLDQVVDPLLCLAALDVSGVHQLSHDLLGPATADLPEDRPRIEVFAYALIACHCTRVSEVLAAGKHFIRRRRGPRAPA